jgi:hypothetical protein
MRGLFRLTVLSMRAALQRVLTVMSLQLVLLAGAAQAGPFEDMEALRRILISHRDAGYMIPVQMNMEKYLNRDVRTALDMARTKQGDDCTRAVRLALFLDAHTADMETLAGRVYGSGLNRAGFAGGSNS